MSLPPPRHGFCCSRPQVEFLEKPTGRHSELQSSWGKACGVSVEQEKDLESCLPSHRLLHLEPDPEAVLHGSLLAVLEVQRKRADELHAELLQRLSAIEARLLQLPASHSSETLSYEVYPRETTTQAETEAEAAVDMAVIHGYTTTTTKSMSFPNTDRDLERAWYQCKSQVRRVVRSSRFEVAITGVIMLSVLISFVELEWEGYIADVALGLQKPGEWQGAELAFACVGHFFNFIFAFEFCMRILAGGFTYLRDPWAWFDAFFVSASIVDSYVLGLFFEGQNQQNLGVMRLVRCARMVRTFRAAKGVKAVRPLILLVQTILGSMNALMWSTVFLFIVQLMGAIFITKSLHSYIMDERNAEEDRIWVNKIFGSGLKSVYTFFEITFSGGWPNTVRPLMEKVGPLYALFFVLYVAVWAFVIMRVIGALFIKETLATAEKVESARHAHEGERKKMMKKIANYFKRADKDKSGSLRRDELEHLFEDPSVKSWCASHEIDLDDAHNLWMLLNSKGSLSVTEFVDGMLRMREPAKAIDLKAVLQTTRSLATKCESIHDKVAFMESRFGNFELPRKRLTRHVSTGAAPANL